MTRFLKSSTCMQVGVGRQVDLDERALGAAEPPRDNYCPRAPVRTCAGLTLSAAICSGFSQMRMAKVRPPRISARCTPRERGQARLDDAGEIIGDLVRLQNIGGEAEISRSESGVGRLDVDHRHLQLPAADRSRT